MLTQSQITKISQTPQTQKYVDEVFQKYDTDKGGFLSYLQFAPAINTVLQNFGVESICNQDINDIFHLLDINGDQRVSRGQFSAIISVITVVIEKNKNLKKKAGWLQHDILNQSSFY